MISNEGVGDAVRDGLQGANHSNSLAIARICNDADRPKPRPHTHEEIVNTFLGNLLAMTAIVGLLYIDSPLRLCNAYLQDDQIRLGQWLVGISSTLGLAWLGTVTHEVMQREAQTCAPRQFPAAQDDEKPHSK